LKEKMNVLDLFSGIGGFSLGLERAGMRTVAFCEIDPFCRKVLAKHWPGVPIYHDVREISAYRLRTDCIAVDVICGGFPCQDISIAGAGAGIEGERSGLWSEYARLIGELRPRYVIVENVAALLSRGLDKVLGDLAALGFDAEWHCIPASAIGAPHERDRIWIVANSRSRRRGEPDGRQVEQPRRAKTISPSEALADTDASYRDGRNGALQMGRIEIAREIADNGYARRAQWSTEPGVGRVAHGIPDRVDRVGSLGNAVVPQIPEIIGRAIMKAYALSSPQ
jgi:DNA (cytosine-5)-methyltransferase 1